MIRLKVKVGTKLPIFQAILKRRDIHRDSYNNSIRLKVKVGTKLPIFQAILKRRDIERVTIIRLDLK